MTRYLAGAVVLLALGCDALSGSEHADGVKSGHGHGHEHGDQRGHGHAGEEDYPAVVVTDFSDTTELFVEFPALTLGRASPFAVHLTRLRDFAPIAEGRVQITLAGGGVPDETFEAQPSSTPGIFRPVATPGHAARRTVSVTLSGESLVRHELGEYEVFADEATARAKSPESSESPGQISFLKEQQWKVEFATAALSDRAMRPSVRTTGHIRARAGGEAKVTVPVPGRITTNADKLPAIGAEVKRGDLLFTLSPRLAGSVDIATLELDVERAQAKRALDESDVKRLEGLLVEGAVAERRVQVARTQAATSAAEERASRRRVAQYNGNQNVAGGGATLPIRAPIDGTVVQSHATSGTFVDEGQELLHIIHLDRLWLEADIPAADIGRVRTTSGAWFEVEGYAEPFEVDLEKGGKLVAFGGVVDPRSRTAPLVFEFENRERAFRVNLFAGVHILTGAAQTMPAIPATALIDDSGRDVVYVQAGGESFERRIVELGPRDRGWVGVRAGLALGDRVVTKGAYYVHLAASSGAVPAHGHAH